MNKKDIDKISEKDMRKINKKDLQIYNYQRINFESECEVRRLDDKLRHSCTFLDYIKKRAKIQDKVYRILSHLVSQTKGKSTKDLQISILQRKRICLDYEIDLLMDIVKSPDPRYFMVSASEILKKMKKRKSTK